SCRLQGTALPARARRQDELPGSELLLLRAGEGGMQWQLHLAHEIAVVAIDVGLRLLQRRAGWQPREQVDPVGLPVLVAAFLVRLQLPALRDRNEDFRANTEGRSAEPGRAHADHHVRSPVDADAAPD